MWADYFEDNFFVKSLYKTVPALVDLILLKHELKSDYDGLYLNFKTSQLPDKPPKKWIGEQYNSIIFQLYFGVVRDFELKIRDDLEFSSLGIAKTEDRLKITFSGKYSGSFHAGVGIIQKILPHLVED